MSMTDLKFVKLHTGGELRGDNVSFGAVSTDSRQISNGDLFIALTGPRFDGHEFVQMAADAGAVAAIVSHAVDCDLPQLVVDDTLLALGRFAAAWRTQFSMPVVGVTGSTGKTTVKQMLASILAGTGDVLATHGNLNNEIGVPLTLLRMRENHRYAVIEMGANHAGEIARLTTLARPTIGIITNAGAAHLEGFGSIEGVVEAKGEMYAGVVDGGICVINGDQPWADDWKQRAGARRKIIFGVAAAHDFHATAEAVHTDYGMQFQMATPEGVVEIHLPLHGQHNVMNALAAAAAAWSAGASAEAIKAGLEKVSNVGGRMHVEQLANGVVLVDDTYNANPVSMRAAIDWLAAGGRRGWLVMGDMGELGADAETMHAEIGAYASECGLERLYCLGTLSAAAADAFGTARSFSDAEQLIERLAEDLEPGVTVLVKGSRSARMERITSALRERGMR